MRASPKCVCFDTLHFGPLVTYGHVNDWIHCERPVTLERGGGTLEANLGFGFLGQGSTPRAKNFWLSCTPPFVAHSDPWHDSASDWFSTAR